MLVKDFIEKTTGINEYFVEGFYGKTFKDIYDAAQEEVISFDFFSLKGLVYCTIVVRED